MKRSLRNSILTMLAVFSFGVALSATRLKLPALNRSAAAPVQEVVAVAAGDSDESAKDLAPARLGREVVLQTDKLDYRAGEVVVVTGSGFEPGETVTLLLHEEPAIHKDRKVAVVADAFGEIFDNQFVQDGDHSGVTFVLTAIGKGSGLTTQAAFGNPSATLDQWATIDGTWVNGNLGPSKARYFEGDSIPYRLRFGSLPLTSHTVTIEWDTTKADKHALDYLTTFNRSVPALPCQGVNPCGSPTTFAIPVDPQVTGGGVTPIAGNFTLYGGTITAVSAYSYANGSGFLGDKSAQITITFTASVANPVLSWGGHISTRVDWGTFNSCVNISGSPFHTRLLGLDGSGGNQDRSLSSDATIFPGSITITKNAVPDDGRNFSFTTTGVGLSGFELDDDGGADATLLNSKNFSVLDFGDKTVTETAVSHWPLTNLSCTESGTQNSTTSLATRTATLKVEEGETIGCTFTNTHDLSSPTIATQVKNNVGGANIADDTSVSIGTVAYDTSTLTDKSSDAGGTVTYYVVKGETCTGGTSLGQKTVTNGSVPSSDTYEFASAGTYNFWAVYSGDANNNTATSVCGSETVVVGLNGPTIATQVKNNAGGADIADGATVSIGTVAYDTSTLSGKTSDAGGTVTYYIVKGETCTGGTSLGQKTVTNGSVPSSNTYEFTSAGTYNFWAVYSGDANNDTATSVCGSETVVVGLNGPTIATQVKNNAGGADVADGATVSIGTVAYDTSTLSGKTSDAGGTVTYYVVKGETCTGGTSLGEKTVTNGSVPSSDTYEFTSAGTYNFWAVYSGDANNDTATSVCGSETVVVEPNSAGISTAQRLIPNDDATLSGLTAGAGGTVTFELYSPSAATCAGTPAYTQVVDVNGNGTYSTTNTAFVATDEGTWRWKVVYSGDANNTGTTSACGVENFTITND